MKTILLVEDNPFMADIYASQLRKEGYKVDVASYSRIALEKIRNTCPDLLLLDIKLPKENKGIIMENEGWEILKIIRSDPKTSNVKVIVLSNYYEKDNASDIADFGVVKYFLKAETTPTEITRVVKEILNQ